MNAPAVICTWLITEALRDITAVPGLTFRNISHDDIRSICLFRNDTRRNKWTLTLRIIRRTHIHRWYKQFMTYWAQTCEICRCSLSIEEIHVDLKRSSICTRRYVEINVLLARQTYIVAVNVNKFVDRLYWSNQQNSIIILNEMM